MAVNDSSGQTYFEILVCVEFPLGTHGEFKLANRSVCKQERGGAKRKEKIPQCWQSLEIKIGFKGRK